jgi:aldehyde:ferredoxin oxidoreductase
MGSKNLKAVAVRGTLQPTAPVNRSKVTSLAKWFGNNYKNLMNWATAGIGIGTLNSVAIWHHVGGLPTNNFSEPLFDEGEKLAGERLHTLFLKDRDTCQACPVKCKQVFEHEDSDPNRRIDPVYGGAEYEAVAAFGSNCGVSDPVAVLKSNELCNAYGLDTISTGMSISFVMECFQRGVLSSADTDGLEFAWGDHQLILESVEMIANRKGFGDVMAEGVDRMSAQFGPESESFNLTIKGQELPLHEPRLKQGMGLGFAVSPMGADHIVNIHDTYYMADGVETRRVNSVLDEPIAPISNLDLDESKLQILHYEINWQHFQDCAVNCHFYCYGYAQMADAISGLTGIDYSVHDVLNVGARAQTMARLFNLREGFTAEDDKLPKRMMQAFESGPLEDVAISPEVFSWAKQRFYALMDWDPETGIPTEECLEGLELDQLLDIHSLEDYSS